MSYGFKLNNIAIPVDGSVPSIDLMLTNGQTTINKKLLYWKGLNGFIIPAKEDYGVFQKFTATYFDGNVTTEVPREPVQVELAAAAAEARWDDLIVTVNDDIVLSYNDDENAFVYADETGFYLLGYSHDQWLFISGIAGTYSLKVVDPNAESGTPYAVMIYTDLESTDVGDEYSILITHEDVTSEFKNAFDQVFHKISIYYDNDTSSYKCDTSYVDIYTWIMIEKEPVMAVITTLSGEIKECWMSEHFPTGATNINFVGVIYIVGSSSLSHEWFFVNGDDTVTLDADNIIH